MIDRTDKAGEIKRLVPMTQAAPFYGLEVSSDGFCRCPFHGEKTASMKVYDGERGWHCYGCHEGGSVIDFVMKLFGLSNHLWDERVPGASGWYKNQPILKAEEAKHAFSLAAPGLRVLFGCETEYYACRDLLGMSEEGASHFDYLLIPHSHLHMRNEVMSDFPEILEAREKVRRDLAQKLP